MSMLLDHGGESLGRPDLIDLGNRMYCLRFEAMKIASAMTAVEGLLEEGRIRPGDTLVDSSSGLYAHALALACHRYGLGCHIVGSTTVDATLRAQLRLLGATLEQMPSSSSLRLDQHRRVGRIRELLQEHPDWHWMRQYHDPRHCQGYARIADMVAALIPGDLNVVVPVGTGASSAGLISRFRDYRTVRAIGVQPYGSVSFGAENVADPDMLIAGIGTSIDFENVVPELFDVMHWVSFAAARSATLALLRDHAVFAGLSSGAAYLAARWDHRLLDTRRSTIFLAPDTGHRYVEAVFGTSTSEPGAETPQDGDAAEECLTLAAGLTELMPHEIADPGDLELPWARMEWNRRGASVAASA